MTGYKIMKEHNRYYISLFYVRMTDAQRRRKGLKVCVIEGQFKIFRAPQADSRSGVLGEVNQLHPSSFGFGSTVSFTSGVSRWFSHFLSVQDGFFKHFNHWQLYRFYSHKNLGCYAPKHLRMASGINIYSFFKYPK